MVCVTIGYMCINTKIFFKEYKDIISSLGHIVTVTVSVIALIVSSRAYSISTKQFSEEYRPYLVYEPLKSKNGEDLPLLMVNSSIATATGTVYQLSFRLKNIGKLPASFNIDPFNFSPLDVSHARFIPMTSFDGILFPSDTREIKGFLEQDNSLVSGLPTRFDWSFTVRYAKVGTQKPYPYFIVVGTEPVAFSEEPLNDHIHALDWKIRYAN